ncbi:hypothetical protein [Flavobacterium sp. GCM10027622]|uniref:hypothetical protein n=1 Tax=unclassified Flavobacterium TaxID=196869 RepID=UPI00360717F6
MDLNEYYEEQRKRVRKIYNGKKHFSYNNRDAFANWYVEQLKKYECRCYYCETSIHDIKRLIDAKVLKTRAVRGNGSRGSVLEIDKDNIYSKDTCVLACYYCNNDKSYTLEKEDYKIYFGENRKKYFKKLLESL